MKRIGFLFLLLISQFVAYAQDYHVVDSIKRLLQNEQIQDTSTVIRYLQLFGEYAWSVPDTSIYYANKALSLSRQLHFTRSAYMFLC
jgi:hypothetical protein